MDCASEESEIRRAVEGVPGVLGLRFQLGERSLRIAIQRAERLQHRGCNAGQEASWTCR